MRPRLSFPFAVLLVLSACRARPPENLDLLPFHIAIKPVVHSPSYELERASTPVDDPAFRIEIDLAHLSESIRGGLDRQGCSKATLLSPPAEGWTEDARQWWIEEARRLRADLLLECELDYSPSIAGSLNGEKFVLNLPVFLLGGPFCYFVNDRRYEVNGELHCRLYDLNPVFRDPSALSRRSEIMLETIHIQPIELDFADRAGKSVPRYALSLLVPPGFLADETEAVLARMHEEICGRLAQDLVAALRENRRQLITAPGIAAFHLDPSPDAHRAQERADGTLDVSAKVLLHLNQGSDELYESVVLAGEQRHAIPFDSPALAGSGDSSSERRYSLHAMLPQSAVRSGMIQLWLYDSSMARNSRSYTLRLRPAAVSPPSNPASRD